MKTSNKASARALLLLPPVALLLLAAGCAPPQTSGDLQQRIDELLQIQQQQAQKLTEMQDRLIELQTTPAVPESSAPGPGLQTDKPLPVPPPTEISSAAAEVAAMSEAAGLYLEAFAAIATGRPFEAETRFGAFVERYPAHEYAGNARYWLAEALLAQHKQQQAETILLDVIANPQQQNKAPAAMARLVRHYRETGALTNAEAMLKKLSSRFPESPELKRLARSTEPR